MEPFGEPLSLPIQSNYRLPLGRSTKGRILSEVSESTAASVRARSTARPHIHLNTQILSATDDHVALSTRRRVRLESHGLDNGQLGQPSIRVWSSSAKNALL